MLAGNGVYEKQLRAANQAALLKGEIGLSRLKHSDPLNVMQTVFLSGQLHDRIRRLQGRKHGAHQRLIGDDLSGPGRDNWLEMIAEHLIFDQSVQVQTGLRGVGFLIVAAKVKFTECTFAGMLDLIHGKVCIFF